MTYLDYLNQFNRWCEDDNPTDKAIILYHFLLDMFNRRGWPGWAGVDTQRLMILARTTDKKVAYRARDVLKNAGLIEYRPGKKGRATEYRLLISGGKLTTGNATESGMCGKSTTENATKNATESATENATENATPNKIKIKTKIKDKDNVDDQQRVRGEHDEGLGRVMAAYLDKINPSPSPASLDELKAFYAAMGAEVCLRAIDTALDAGHEKANWRYIRAILRSKREQGVKCLADWDRLEAERNRAGQTGQTRNAIKTHADYADDEEDFLSCLKARETPLT